MHTEVMKTFMYWSIGILILFFISAYYIVTNPLLVSRITQTFSPTRQPAVPTVAQTQQIKTITQQAWQGDNATAINNAQAIANDPSNPLAKQAGTLASTLLFANATTSNGRANALSIMIGQYEAASSTHDRAWALDRILLAVDIDASLTPQVFARPEFASYYIATSTNVSLFRLALLSVRTMNTSIAQLEQARFHILQALRVSALRTRRPAAASTFATEMSLAKSSLAKADSVFAQESNIRRNSILQILVPASYLSNKAGLLSLLANLDASYLPDAERAFNQLIAYDTTTARGKPFPALVPFTQGAQRQLAELLLDVASSTRRADAGKLMDTFATSITDNPTISAGDVTLIQQAALVPQGQAVFNARYGASNFMLAKNEYDRDLPFTALAPSFKALLIQEGWKF